MKQVTITTGKATIVVVELPESASGIHVEDDLICFDFKEDGITYPDYKILHGQWRYIGEHSQLREEDWKGIVDPIDSDDALCGYERYMSDEEFNNSDLIEACSTATESGLSLLKANGVLMDNPRGDQPHNTGLVHLYPTGHPIDDIALKAAIDWLEAQKDVWLNPQIFVKV